MFYLNKIVGCTVTPVGLAFMMLLMGLVFNYLRNRALIKTKVGRWFIIAAAIWLWLWSTPLMSFFVGVPLEREFLINGKVPTIESYPEAEAILLLGGGMGADERLSSYAEMWNSADRVWMAAQLYKAGKAPKIYATGGRVEMSTCRLLTDFGVPREAIVFDEAPRNTEEEAKAAAKRDEKKVLLVTSAWHMKRSRLMFNRYALNIEVIPAPCDFENTISTLDIWSLSSLFPSVDYLRENGYSFKEWLAFFGYKVFR